MELIIVAILAILIGLSFGIVGGLLGRKIISKNKLSSAELEALQIVESAKEEEKALIIKAKEQALKVQSERDSEYRERRSEISQVERRLSNREDNLERRSSNIERRERTLSDKNKEADQLRTELETIKDQELEKLEEISSLSIVEARSNIMEQAQQDIEHELAVYFREEEEKAKEEASSKARTIVSEAIQRLASDVVSEASLTSVPLPSDDMKGRIIGREGRNIRAIEKSTGVDIIIDDNPEAVTLSCFDPIRREIARIESGEWPAEDNPLVNAPHPAEDLLKDDWRHPYTRQEAAFPLPSSSADKYWPPVSRIDGAHGDRNLVCNCPSPRSFEELPS